MPLLFVTFSATLGIDMARLSMLISVNFVTQLGVDVLAGQYVDRIGSACWSARCSLSSCSSGWSPCAS